MENECSIFDIDTLYYALEQCYYDENIPLEPYLIAFKELCKFCKMLGTILTFVTNDIEHKIAELYAHYNSTHFKHYKNCKSMIIFEKNEGLLQNKNLISGSRILLTLHRSLAFLEKFLSRLIDLNMESKLGSICRQSYNESLAKYHPWIIRKAVFVASSLLPTKQELSLKMGGKNLQIQAHLLETLPKVVLITNKVFIQTNKILTENDCLDL